MGENIPESMEDLVYWTSRKIGNGNIKAWVYRGECPKCHKGLMGKPIGPDGKVKTRANYYECTECGNNIDKQGYEESLDCECIYTCPECSHKGEAVFPFKRKKYKGVDALVFNCEKCNAKIAITKKLKNV
ncbi:hypothetical protein JXB41_06905 [Candidatus Woesearchaeota archaeon]|nr:hypothetical protein [Candidatus Woesearchaeota archaeon]